LELFDLFFLADRLSVDRVLEPLDHRFKVREAPFYVLETHRDSLLVPWSFDPTNYP
jgi:hypothetical protein